MLNPNRIFTRRGVALPKRIFPTVTLTFQPLKQAQSTKTFNRGIIHPKGIGAGIGNFQVEVFQRLLPGQMRTNNTARTH
jgi:hypothetical protein